MWLIVKNMTPFSFWYLISALHFSRVEGSNYGPKELFDKAVKQLNSISLTQPVRVLQPFVKSSELEAIVPLNESQKKEFDQLVSAIRKASSQKSETKMVPLSSRRTESKTKEQYTSEDDEWILSIRQAVQDFTSTHTTPINLEDNLNVIQKLSLDDIVSVYEAELNSVCHTNRKNLENLETKLLTQVKEEQWRTEFSLPSDDILFDLKLNIPYEEQFMEYLERKQLEGKDLLKPGEPIRAPGTKYKPRIALEDMVCHVCNDGDYTDDDLIVFCAVILIEFAVSLNPYKFSLEMQYLCTSVLLWNQRDSRK